MRIKMEYHNLGDDGAEKAWCIYQKAIEEYKKNPMNRDNYTKVKDAFEAYDELRLKLSE